MMSSSSKASSSSTPFDARRIIGEIQAANTSASSSGPNLDSAERGGHDDDEEEDDFMSDKFLPIDQDAPRPALTYSEKRRRLGAYQAARTSKRGDTSTTTKKSLTQHEEEARHEGLARDLLAEAEIIAGGGVLPAQDRYGRTKWELLNETHRNSRNTADEAASSGGETSTIRGGTGGREQDGTAKAMKMMLAMGYRRGQALGRQARNPSEDVQQVEEEEEEDDDDETSASGEGGNFIKHSRPSSDDENDADGLDTDEETAIEREKAEAQALEEDEYLSGGLSTSVFGADVVSSRHSNKSGAGFTQQQEPLRMDQRWLGPNRRAGIGMIAKTKPSISKAIQDAATSSHSKLQQEQEDQQQQKQQEQLESNFRARVSQAHQERHIQGLLLRARKTLMELDRTASANGVDTGTEYSPLWLDSGLYLQLSGLSAHDASSNTVTTIDEKMQSDPGTKEAFDLLQRVFSSQDPTQIKEAQSFCLFPSKVQLKLILDALRTNHQYCLFCGCKYQNAEDLKSHCPGEEEEDHD